MKSEPVSIGNMPTEKPESSILGVIDRYELISELGGGGFGSVYLARDTVAGVLVAVKGLPPLVKNIPEELECIRKNFVLVSQLSHSNIASLKVLHLAQNVHYHDPSAKEKLRVMPGDYLVVMEHARGVTLSQWKRQFKGGRVSYELAVEICRQIAEALDYAHGQKIAHRDIKPSNIMVETITQESGGRGQESVCPPVSGGRKRGAEDNSSFSTHPSSLSIKVLDFGLAAEIRSSMSRVSKESGDTSGTRPYMAPEQWTGRKQGAATDQYALAVLFYELVSGEVPFTSVFKSGDMGIMANAVENKLPEVVEGLSKKQNAALLMGLAKEREQRFGSCGDFVAAMGGSGRSSKVLKFGSSKVGGRQKSAWFRVVAALVVLVCLVLSGVLVLLERDKPILPPPISQVQVNVIQKVDDGGQVAVAGDVPESDADEKKDEVVSVPVDEPREPASIDQQAVVPETEVEIQTKVAPRVEPESVVNNNKPENKNEATVMQDDFEVKLELVGGCVEFAEGEKLQYRIRSERDCYVALLCYQVDGTTVVLFPNLWNSDCYIRAGRDYLVPEAGSGFEIEVSPPFGEDRVEVIACTGRSEFHHMLGDYAAVTTRGMPFYVVPRAKVDEAITRGMKSVAEKEEGELKWFRKSIYVSTKSR